MKRNAHTSQTAKRANMIGWRLTRTSALAEGGKGCHFRFQQGGATLVSLPEPVRTSAAHATG